MFTASLNHLFDFFYLGETVEFFANIPSPVNLTAELLHGLVDSSINLFLYYSLVSSNSQEIRIISTLLTGIANKQTSVFKPQWDFMPISPRPRHNAACENH